MRLLLVRHGPTDWNVAHRFQGQADMPLNDAGHQQAEALAKRLAGESIHAIYTSDLQRAQQTAQTIATIAALHGCAVIPEPRLRELSFGTWEGLTYDEIGQRDSAALKKWETNLRNVAPPGGESLILAIERVHPLLQEIQRRNKDKTVLVVAHGGPLQILLCLALGLSPDKHWQFALAPALVSEVLFYPAGAMVNLLNDRSHLTGASL